MLIFESSDKQNSAFASNIAKFKKYADSRQILTMFEKLREARDNFQLVYDLKQARNSSQLAKSKVSHDSLNSCNKIFNFKNQNQNQSSLETIMELDAEPLPGKGKKFIF